jgi:hypothetical protein
VTIGAEEDEAPVMLAGRLGYPQHQASRVAVGAQGVLGAALIGDHANRSPVVGVGDVEEPAGGVVGREGDREQALLVPLAIRLDLAADVEERARPQAIVGEDPHGAVLLDDEELRVGPRGLGHVHRLLEATDPLQRHELGSEHVFPAAGDAYDGGRDGHERSDGGFDLTTAEGGQIEAPVERRATLLRPAPPGSALAHEPVDRPVQ